MVDVMPSSSPSTVNRWSAMRQWLSLHTPSLTLARALERGDEAFIKDWRYSLVNDRPFSERSKRALTRHDAQGFTPMQQMVRHGRMKDLALVAHYAPMNAPLQLSAHGQRLLDLAPDGITRNAVQALLHAGLRQTFKDSYVAFLTDQEWPPIHAHAQVLTMLPWLKAGADPNFQPLKPQVGGDEPLLLHMAGGNVMLHATRVLLEHGADPHQHDRRAGHTTPYQAMQRAVAYATDHPDEPTLDARKAGALAILALYDRQEVVQLERVLTETLAEQNDRPVHRARSRL